MRTLLLLLFLGVSAFATSWPEPIFPLPPTNEELLENLGLSEANDDALLEYVRLNRVSITAWIPSINEQEESTMREEYFRRLEQHPPGTDEYWKRRIDELNRQRLSDSRRIVDAALRRLGQRGSVKALGPLLDVSGSLELVWAQWKIYAASQEILQRSGPASLTQDELRSISPEVVGPLLRDIEPDRAEEWAWVLWQQWSRWMEPFLESRLSIRGRLWMSRSFCRRDFNAARRIFREGVQSKDAATRTFAEMLLREGLGNSMPAQMSGEAMLEQVNEKSWKPTTKYWEVMPKPLDSLYLQGGGGSGKYLGRVDVVYLDRNGTIFRHQEDVWPTVAQVLPNGLFYSRAGSFYPTVLKLTDTNGVVFARFPHLQTLSGLVASHGGIWSLTAMSKASEYGPDGTVLWEAPMAGTIDVREIAPHMPGRVLLLGYKWLQCIDRRGDVLWKINLEGFDDPRGVVSVDENTFVLTCKKSIGWLKRDGSYVPLVKKLGSAIRVRFHPSAEWVIFDGANGTAHIYDPQTEIVTSRVDLDERVDVTPSKFATEFHFPE